MADGTGVSAGQVSKTDSWKAFREKRDAEKKPVPREIPLSDAIQAAVPGDCESPEVLAALIEEQQADDAERTPSQAPSRAVMTAFRSFFPVNPAPSRIFP